MDFEQTIRRNDDKVDRIKYYFLYVMSVFFAFGTLMGLFSLLGAGFTVVGLLQALVCGGIATYSFFMKDNMLVEYDYSMEDEALKFAKVMNLKKRKELLSINTDCIVCIAPVSDERVQSYTQKQDIKLYNFTLNGEEVRYFLYAEQSASKILVYFEPKEEMLKKLKQKKSSMVRL